MVANSETVHRRPQNKSGPFSHMWMNLTSCDQHTEVAQLSSDHCGTPLVRSIAYETHHKDDKEGKTSTNCCERISWHSFEAESPVDVSKIFTYQSTATQTNMMMEGV